MNTQAKFCTMPLTVKFHLSIKLAATSIAETPVHIIWMSCQGMRGRFLQKVSRWNENDKKFKRKSWAIKWEIKVPVINSFLSSTICFTKPIKIQIIATWKYFFVVKNIVVIIIVSSKGYIHPAKKCNLFVYDKKFLMVTPIKRKNRRVRLAVNIFVQLGHVITNIFGL